MSKQKQRRRPLVEMLERVTGRKAILFGSQSESVGFSIKPYTAPANGKITAIRVQDIARGKWFNYDNGVWDSPPEVTVGAGNLYIAAYATNVGGEGELHLILNETAAYRTLASKKQVVAAGAGFGIETGTIDMPDSPYGLIVMVTP